MTHPEGQIEKAPEDGCCRVCRARDLVSFMSVAGRDYLRCGTCCAILLASWHLPSRDEEKAEYLLHENDPDDKRYRQFLMRLVEPLRQRLLPGSTGLDYGCGPGPTLDRMLTEEGHRVRRYDPFFHPDDAALHATYDFITCSEVAEHFHHPAAEFDRLDGMLCPGGWLGIMTRFYSDEIGFANWHYRRDPTHVVFYREETLRCIAHARGWRCEIPEDNVAVLHKVQTQRHR